MVRVIQNKDKFTVLDGRLIENWEQDILTKLYLPICGLESIGFYKLLRLNYRKQRLTPYLYHSIESLLMQGSINTVSLVKNLVVLEKEGLIKTYEKRVNNVSLYAFYIQKVPNADEFFKNKKLVDKLERKTNIDYIREAKDYFKTSNYDEFLSEFTNVTSGILANMQRSDKIKTIAWREIFDKIPDFKVKEAFFKQRSTLLIKLSNADISIGKFIKILIKAYSSDDGLIDLKLIDELISNSELLNSDFETLDVQESFLNSKNNLIKAMQRLNPINFVYQLLAQKGRQLNKHQKHIITKFCNAKSEENRLYQDEMINLASYTCIEIYDSFNTILFKTLLEDWKKNNIENCNKGLDYVRNHQNSYHSSVKRVEQGTDWKKKLANKTTSDKDDADLAKIMKNLRKFDPKE